MGGKIGRIFLLVVFLGVVDAAWVPNSTPADKIRTEIKKMTILSGEKESTTIVLQTLDDIPWSWPRSAVDSQKTIELQGTDSTEKNLGMKQYNYLGGSVGPNNCPMGSRFSVVLNGSPRQGAEWIQLAGACVVTPFIPARELGPLPMHLRQGEKIKSGGTSIEVMKITKMRYISELRKEEVDEDAFLDNGDTEDTVAEVKLVITVPEGEFFHSVSFSLPNKMPLKENMQASRTERKGNVITLLREFKTLPEKVNVYLELSKKGEAIRIPVNARVDIEKQH